jgi:hypothetical protein
MTNNPQPQNQLNLNQPTGYISLPYDEQQFKEFLLSLLGRPQTLEKRIHGEFNIEKNDVLNFYHLLDQRIHQQNKAQLILFNAKIYFREKPNKDSYMPDESSHLLTSFPELESYNETRPLISEAILLSWTYLIQFPGKNTPEKQEIDVFIGTAGDFIDDSDLQRIAALRKIRNATFKLAVRCTARTWGIDVIELFTREAHILIKSEDKLKKSINKNSGWIGFVTSLSFWLISLIVANSYTSRLVSKDLTNFNELISQNPQTEKLIVFLTNYLIVNNNSPRILFIVSYLLFMTVISIVVGIFISSKGTINRKSFLLLTREALKERSKFIKSENRDWFIFWLSIPVSLILNIIASYLFLYLTTR